MPNPPPKSARPAPLAPPRDLRAHYRLGPQPQGVDQIAGLVHGKETANMEEIVRIITRDQAVTQRCMVAAYPKASMREGATLEMAATRLGLARVISLIVADLLQQTILDTFDTMVGLEMKSENPADMPVAAGGMLIGSARFTGCATGDVLLGFPHGFSRFIAAQVLGGRAEDTYAPEMLHDAVGELVNIVTGNLQSRLSDAGLPSEMGLPVVRLQPIFPTVTILGGTSERFYFRSGNHHLGVNLCIAPFSKGPVK
ncbi:MAG: chemotaxis protein CheX [Verrucomicrobiota bacterium]